MHAFACNWVVWGRTVPIILSWYLHSTSCIIWLHLVRNSADFSTYLSQQWLILPGFYSINFRSPLCPLYCSSQQISLSLVFFWAGYISPHLITPCTWSWYFLGPLALLMTDLTLILSYQLQISLYSLNLQGFSPLVYFFEVVTSHLIWLLLVLDSGASFVPWSI